MVPPIGADSVCCSSYGSVAGWLGRGKEGDDDVVLQDAVVNHDVDLLNYGCGGQGAGEVLKEGEGGQSGGGRKHCH